MTARPPHRQKTMQLFGTIEVTVQTILRFSMAYVPVMQWQHEMTGQEVFVMSKTVFPCFAHHDLCRIYVQSST